MMNDIGNLKIATLKGVSWNSISISIKVLSQVLTLLILARLLNPTEFGYISIITIVLGFFLLLVEGGFGTMIVCKPDLSVDQLSTLFWLNILCAVFLILFLNLAAPLITAFYQSPQITSLIRISSLSILGIAINQQFSSLCQRDLHFRFIAINEIITSIFTLTLTLILASIFRDASSYAIGYMSGTFVAGAGIYLMSRRKYSIRFSFTKKDLSNNLKFAFLQLTDKSINYLNVNIDKLLIGKLFGIQALGFYNLAFQIILRPLMVINPIINRVSLPLYVRISDDFKKLNSVYIKNVKHIISVTFPIYLSIYIFADEIVKVILGPQYVQCIPIIRIFCLLGAFWTVGNPIGSYLLSLNKLKFGILLTVYQGFIIISLIYIGSFYSFTVFLYIFTFGYIIFMLPIDYFIRYKITNMSIIDHFKSYIGIGMITIICGLLMRILRGEVNQSYFIIIGIVSFIIYLSIVLLLNRELLHFLKSQIYKISK